jgi:hypothetical protein
MFLAEAILAIRVRDLAYSSGAVGSQSFPDIIKSDGFLT